MGLQTAVAGWLEDRFGVAEAVEGELHRPVPNYAAAAYHYLGAVAVILIGIEFITGFLLGLYYVPDGAGNPAPAYSSVVFIQHTAYLGWLIRGVHFWGANLLLGVALAYMTAAFWNGDYRAPRELNWMVGVLMLLTILALSLTGYLLPWDNKAYFATEVTIKIAGSAPPAWLGTAIKEVLQGGPVVGPPTLQRFFTLHVFVLPALIVLLMYVHFRFIRAHGISEPL